MRTFPAACQQQSHELALGRLQRRIRHVVDEPDREVHVGILRMTEYILSPQLVGARPGLTISRRLSNSSLMAGPNRLFRGLKPRTRPAGLRERLVDILNDV